MSQPTYIEAVFAAWDTPDAWDAGGAAFAGSEQAFKELGTLATKQKTGSLSLADAKRMDAVAQYFANSMSNVAAKLSSIDVGTASPDDRKLKAFIGKLVQQGQTLSQATGLLLDDIAAGDPFATEKLASRAASLLKFGGNLLAVTQVGMAYHFNGAEEGAKKLMGALGGLGGSAVGAWFGGAAVNGIAGLAGATASGLAVSAGAIFGAAALSFYAGKSFEEAYSPFIRPLLGEMFETGGAAYRAAETFWSDSLASLGRFDGTWLASPKLQNLSDNEKAQLTALFAGASQLQASSELYADLNKLFSAPFDGSTLVSRDVLIHAVLLIAQEQHAYISERISVSAGIVSLDFPPGAPLARDAIRQLVRAALPEADRAGFAMHGPSRIVIAPEGGTLAAVDGKDNLLIGSSQVDGLIGGDGSDDLIAGAGDDTLIGGANTDDLFGGDGNDVLDGGEGSDYLRGGEGHDTYKFVDEWGTDTLIDSDGQGAIELNGVTLEGGRKVADGVWLNRAQGVVYALVGEGVDQMLVIQRDSSLNSIRIRNWQNGQLGLVMDDTEEELTTPTQVFLGDQRALIRGIETELNILPGDPRFNTYLWAGTSRAADGTLIGGVAEAGFNDVIFGSSAADRIDGLGGNDALDGLAGSDDIDGGDGDDLIAGGSGSDHIRGGAGRDTILAATVLDLYQRVGPNDHWSPPEGTTQWAAGSNWGVYITGPGARTTEGSGPVTMDSAGDTVDAGAGDDQVIGGLGGDHLDGGDGDDSLWGHGGSDTVYGGFGADYMIGDGILAPDYYQSVDGTLHGNDFMDGGEGDDGMVGGGADDVLYGGAGRDLLWGDDQRESDLAGRYHGNDYLDGEEENDQLIGGGGNDTLQGGDGDDKLWGDAEDERTLAGGFQGADLLDGGSGNDAIIGGGADDALFGGDGNDTLDGDDTEERLAGRFHGADILDGGKGNDWISGNGGNDQLFGGDGDDSLEGDDRSERELAGRYHGDDRLDGEEGSDTLVGGGGADILVGGNGNDLLYGDTDESALAGTWHGDDTLDGGEGNDQLVGGGGNDTLFGGNGGDNMHGDASLPFVTPLFHGADVLDGGEGNDTIYGDGGDDTLYGDAGDDFLSGDNQSRAAERSTLKGDDTLYGGDGNDLLLGGNGRDSLSGDAGDDTLWGGDDEDLLTGGAGNDTLRGGDGADQLDGGDGHDLLSGGAGDDIYHWGTGSGNDGIDEDDPISGAGGADLLQLAGLRADGVRFERVGDDCVITALATSETITIRNQFVPAAEAEGRVERIQYADGSIADLPEARRRMVGTGSTDVLDGTDGADILEGGKGRDLLRAGAGADTYLYRSGDGDDLILESEGGGPDTLELRDLLPEDIRVAEGDGNGNDRIIDTRTGQALTLDLGLTDQSLELDRTVEQVRFADGSLWTNSDLREAARQADLLIGTAKADRLEGFGGNDALEGRAGADQLIGGSGDDTYRWRTGDGNDRIDDKDGFDTLELNGLRRSDVVLSNSSAGDLQVRVRRSGEIITVVGGSDPRRPGSALERLLFTGEPGWTVVDLQSKTGFGAAPGFQQTSTGQGMPANAFLDRSVQSLVEAMAVFSVPAAGFVSADPMPAKPWEMTLAASSM